MPLAEYGSRLITTGAAVTGLALVVFVLHAVVSHLSSPLRTIPGPFWAKFTDIWRLLDYWKCTHIQSHQELHRKHGSAVRIGPNMVSLSDPNLLKQVYDTRGNHVKSDFYEVADAQNQGHRLENVFSTRSNYFHARYMKPYQKYFSINAILGKEHLIDHMVECLCRELEKRFVDGDNAGKIADLADWIEYSAWDLDWNMTFSQDMGFLRTGTDVQQLIHTGEMIMRYLGCIGQMPWLDRWLGKNPWCPIKFATFDNAAFYSFQRVMERQAQPEKQKHGDFLDNFLEAKETHPDIVGDNEIVSYIMMNVLAGGDTTAIVQKAITYYILKHPAVHKKLVAELDSANLAFPPRYEQTRDLPYLNAVIKEGMRMHPVISGILERIVPESGLRLSDGRIIAPGTKVGINPWVTTRCKEVYGEDAEDYRPERWLKADNESEDAYQARLKVMKDTDFTFGAGRRVCVGSNMATVEIHKITSTLFSRYELAIDPNNSTWAPRWWWFTFIDNIKVSIRRRPNAPALAPDGKA